ncbi:MAG: hypothetical protein JSR45_12340 [Proteobacteria bacterium]|nr:hypothetical protein [Pseudomonadota bacterium]
MTSATALILTLIVAAFTIFAVTLAVVRYWSNRAPKPAPGRAAQDAGETHDLRRAA